MDDKNMPVWIKSLVLKQYVICHMIKGNIVFAQVYLCDNTRRAQQTLYAMGQKALGVSGNADKDIMMMELSIQPLSAIFKGDFMRAFAQWRNPNTHGYMSDLINNPSADKHGKTWTGRASKMYENIKKEIVKEFKAEAKAKAGIVGEASKAEEAKFETSGDEKFNKLVANPKTFGRFVKDHETKKKLKSKKSKTSRRYMEFNLTKHSKHVLRTIEPRSGMEALRALRCGGLITVKQMNDRNQLKGNWTNKCPMCNQVVDRGEDELHLVLFCKRWSAAREEFLLPLVKEGQQKRQRDGNKFRNNLYL